LLFSARVRAVASRAESGIVCVVRPWLALLVAGAALAGARGAREAAGALARQDDEAAAPYTPSPSSAPYVSLGYREMAADLLYVRLRGYWGEYYGTTADAIAALGEAITALDPKFYGVYEYAANAITIAEGGMNQSALLRAVALLERGVVEFPKDWRIPFLAGQIYLQDLQTEDGPLRRQWDERGVSLVESAIRKPGAPQKAALWAAHIRTRMGQRSRAVEGMRELLLTTTNEKVREELLARIAKLAESPELAAEIVEARNDFERAWRAERPYVNASMYVVLGPPSPPGFDLAELALGGRELTVTLDREPLEPLDDEPSTPAH
jgi:hypothetical protein